MMILENLIRYVQSRTAMMIPIAVAVLLLAASRAEALSVSQPVRVSPAGHTVAEFSAATSPVNPQVVVASAMDPDERGNTRCVVYVSRDGGGKWSEVVAWPESPQFEPVGDPWVAIGPDGIIHATCIAKTPMGSRVGYTQSRDEGVSWSPPATVTPLLSRFHRRSADKDALAIGPDGAIYVCFTQILDSPLGTRGLVVSRSADQGRTWTSRHTGAANTYCNGMATAPNGVVTVDIIRADDLRYGTVTSTNGGDGWGAPVMLGQINGENLPSITRDGTGRTVLAEVAGTTAPSLDISVENVDGTLANRWQVPAPPSSTCQSGRLIQPALTADPAGLPTLQVGCKADATSSTAGRQEIWLYPNIDQPNAAPAPVEVTGFDLPPAGTSGGSFAQRFPDGGDYWSLTWLTGGWLSMWIDPRTGGGPGELMAARVTE